MGIFSKDDDDPSGSGDGGTLGTPTSDTKETPTSSDEDENMVVSGGGVARPSDESPAT